MSLSIPPGAPAGGPVTFSGLASGLNTSQIIQAELAPENAIIARYQAEEGTLTAEQTAWQGIQTDLQSLLTQTQALLAPNAFNAMTATSSAPTVLTATAQPGAPAGTYSLTVTALAQAQESVSSGTASDPAQTGTFGTGTITIQVGTQIPVTITIASGQDSLNGIAAAINQASAGVTASVINNGTSYQILLSANATGTANAFTVTTSLSGGTTSLGPFTAVQPAQNAQITLGGGTGALTVTSQSNTVTDLVPGVALTLAATGSAQVTVSTDASGITSLIQGWVGAYNQVQKDLDTQDGYNTTTEQPGGPLFGNPFLDVIGNALADAATEVVAGAPSTMNSLGLLGITMNSDGTLSVNTATLQSQITVNPQGIAQLMQGIANSLEPSLQSLSAQVTGAVAAQIQALAAQSTEVQRTITALQQQLAQEQAILQQEFVAMEQAVAPCVRLAS